MSKGKLVAVCVVWLSVLAVGVLAWRLVFMPRQQAAEQRDRQQEEERLAQRRAERNQSAGSPSRYRYEIDFRLDSFSGYSILRSSTFADELASAGIRIELQDDGADYPARLRALQSGDAQMAAFTIDALIKTSAALNELPATIVAVVDETTGADAIVTYQSQLPNIDALNNRETRFVLTADSPSETLARVVMSRFNLDNLAEDPFVKVSDASEVYDRYRQSKPSDPLAYVVWEPYVSQILKNSKTHKVVDSSRFPSTIVDVIVASSDFLIKNREVVGQFVQAYLRAVYKFRDRADMVQLVRQDAQQAGSPLTEQEASQLVDGIWWKNTQENLAHAGLLPGKSLPHLEDMIGNLTEVLLSTGGLAADPTQGNPNYLYHRRVFESLQDFHPGSQTEDVREIDLPALSDQQWEQLEEVGQARVSDLVFARGSHRLDQRSRRILDELAENLTTTRYYVLIRGNASLRGDLERNKIIAEQRAREAEQYLIGQGVDRTRIRAVGAEPSGTTSVTFVLGQLPY